MPNRGDQTTMYLAELRTTTEEEEAAHEEGKGE